MTLVCAVADSQLAAALDGGFAGAPRGIHIKQRVAKLIAVGLISGEYFRRARRQLVMKLNG